MTTSFLHRIQRLATWLILIGVMIVLPWHPILAHGSADNDTLVDVYFNEACPACASFIDDELVPALKSEGYDPVKKDYINEKSYRQEMNEHSEELGIPLELRSHIMTFIGDELVLGGHVPTDLLAEVFQRRDELPTPTIIYQDVMIGMKGAPDTGNVNYLVWSPGYGTRSYPLESSISSHIDWLRTAEQQSETSEASFLPLVISAGFLDGLNPCAFAVLLFFISFLYAIKRSRKGILAMGGVYIAGVFIAYVLIGLGLLKAILISGTPHLLAVVASWLIIALGILQFLKLVWPSMPFRLGIPSIAKGTIVRWLEKATLPTALIAGFLVGLCTFPCSGGVYVGIISLLSTQTTFLSGLGYLLFYNVMFILPLAVILAIAGNRATVGVLEKWEKRQAGWMHALSGLLMIALGAVILVFFV